MVEPVYSSVISLAKLVFRGLGIRFAITGTEHVPATGGAVLVMNHVGYLDFTFAGFAVSPSGRLVRFMAKKSVFDHKVSGPLMRGMKHIPVDRTGDATEAYEAALTALRAGEIVGVFPEATISESYELKQFKTGAVRMAKEAGVPLLPCVLWGSQRIYTKNRKRDYTRGTPVRVVIGEPFTPPDGDAGGEGDAGAQAADADHARGGPGHLPGRPAHARGHLVAATVARRHGADAGRGRGPEGLMDVGQALAQVAARERQVRAFVALAPPQLVRARADAGPLAGLPVGVKDVFDTADLPTAYGSPRWTGHRPAADAAVVARLREAGAVVVGKTVSTEFALFDPPVTVNPHDPTRTPGGSSSGSAAAVAAGMVPLALGTQTVGSVVRPASFCGVWGLVPSAGLVPREGLRALAPSFDRVGLLAASVDLLPGCCRCSPSARSRRRPAGRPVSPWSARWSGSGLAGHPRPAGAHRAPPRGADVLTLPPLFDGLADAHRAVLGPEAALALGAEADAGAAASVGATVREGRAVLGTAYLAALARIGACRQALAALAAPYDALLVPAAVGEAPPRATTGDPVMNRAWTALALPLLAVPGARGPGGLPVGVQLVGRPGRDLTCSPAGAPGRGGAGGAGLSRTLRPWSTISACCPPSTLPACSGAGSCRPESCSTPASTGPTPSTRCSTRW